MAAAAATSGRTPIDGVAFAHLMAQCIAFVSSGGLDVSVHTKASLTCKHLLVWGHAWWGPYHDRAWNFISSVVYEDGEGV